MSEIIDLTLDEPGRPPIPEVIYIPDSPRERRLARPEQGAGGGHGEGGAARDDLLAARTEEECDPTVKRDGEYQRVLVGRCPFINERGEREETALVYLFYTALCGVGVFTGEDVPKGTVVFVYGGKLEYLEPCSRGRLPADYGTHILTLPGRLGINSKVTQELTWKYYVEYTRNVAGFSNASRNPNCALFIHPKPDGVANYVLQQRGVKPGPGETQVVAFFRATEAIPKGTQLFWDYRCDPHPGQGGEMVLVDPSPPRGRW